MHSWEKRLQVLSDSIIRMIKPFCFNKEGKVSRLLSVIIGSIVFSFVAPLFVFAAAQQVRVFHHDGPDGEPRAHFETNLSGISIAPLQSCPSKEELERYWGNDFSKYAGAQAKKAACMNGWMQASLLSGKIRDVGISIGEIETLLKSIEKTISYVKGLNGINGLAVVSIPSGKIEVSEHEYAKKIGMQCIVDVATQAKAPGEVGLYAVDLLDSFITVPKSQVDLFNELTKKNLEIDKAIKAELAKGKGLSIGFLANPLDYGLVFKLKSLQKEIAENFIPITTADYEENYKHLQRMNPPPAMPMTMTYELKDGKPQFFDTPGFVKMLIPDAKMAVTTITVGATSYPNSWVPEEFMKSMILEALAKHKARLLKYQSSFKVILAALEAKLKALKDNDYGCNP